MTGRFLSPYRLRRYGLWLRLFRFAQYGSAAALSAIANTRCLALKRAVSRARSIL